VQTLGGIIEPASKTTERVRVDMGVPAFGAQSVGFDATGLSSRTVGDDTVWILDEAERAHRCRSSRSAIRTRCSSSTTSIARR